MLSIALARQRGAYRDRKASLTADQIIDLKRRIAAGEGNAHVAREFGVSRETVYQYLRAPALPLTPLPPGGMAAYLARQESFKITPGHDPSFQFTICLLQSCRCASSEGWRVLWESVPPG
jgi:hypothetical protein